MCHTSICIGGNFEWLVYEWVPIFRAQVYEWSRFWRCRAALPYQNAPLVTPEVTIDALSQFDAIYLRNKFHFSEVHGSMNTTGPVAFILPWTSEKKKFISYIYILFLHRFCSLSVEFWFKSWKWAAKKSYNPTCLVITFNSRHYDMMANQLLHLSMTSITRNVAWTRVVHGCTNLVGPK